MRVILAIALAAGVTVAAAQTASAAQGCGRGFHRAPHGRCVPNRGRGPIVVAPGALVVGNYYHGRGYWDGRRYYHNRYRYHGGWRYR